jgi:hypothetical protein
MRSIHSYALSGFSVVAQVGTLLAVPSYALNGLSLVAQAGAVGAVLLSADDSFAATVTVPGGGGGTLVPNFSYSTPQQASSGLVYDWQGICSAADPLCQGSQANATLMLGNSYIPGQSLHSQDIVSFHYYRPGGTTALTLDLTKVGTATSGTLPTSAGDPLVALDLFFQTAGQDAFTYDRFIVNADGSWDLGFNFTDPGHLVGGTPPITFTFGSGADGNTTAGASSFSAPVNFPDVPPPPGNGTPPPPDVPPITNPNPVPEPGTIPLLALGLAGMGLLSRNRKKIS